MLTIDQLRAKAPSIFATKPFHKMSEKYHFIPTVDVVEALAKEGFYPAKAMESRVRSEDKKGYARHLIRFRNDERGQQVGDIVPEVILTNSHDGTSAFQMSAGMYRLVCSNGMTVGNDIINVRQRHSGQMGDIIEGVYSVVEEFPQIVAAVDTWRHKVLTPQQQLAFAKAAIPLRWTVEETGTAPVTASQLLRPLRNADIGDDLWRTFNRVQEHIIKGGVRAQMANGRRRASTAVKSVHEDQRLNKALWTLATELAAAV